MAVFNFCEFHPAETGRRDKSPFDLAGVLRPGLVEALSRFLSVFCENTLIFFEDCRELFRAPLNKVESGLITLPIVCADLSGRGIIRAKGFDPPPRESKFLRSPMFSMALASKLSPAGAFAGLQAVIPSCVLSS